MTSACAKEEPTTIDLGELYWLGVKPMSVGTRWISSRAPPLCRWQDRLLAVGGLGPKTVRVLARTTTRTLSPDLARASHKRTLEVLGPPPCVAYPPSLCGAFGELVFHPSRRLVMI